MKYYKKAWSISRECKIKYRYYKTDNVTWWFYHKSLRGKTWLHLSAGPAKRLPSPLWDNTYKEITEAEVFIELL